MSKRSREADAATVASAPRANEGMGRFGIMWAGFLISLLGTSMARFAIAIQVFLDTDSVTRFALVPLSAAIPVLLLSPFAGAVADRFDRRLVILICIFGATLPKLFLWHLVATDRLEYWHIYPLIALTASFGAFTGPTLGAMIPIMVGKQHYARASGLMQTGSSLARVAGPLLGGGLLPILGLANMVLINYASSLIAVLAVLVIRIPNRTLAPAAGAIGTASEREQTLAQEAAGSAAQPVTATAAASASPATASRPTTPDSAAKGRTFLGRRLDAGWLFVRDRPGLLRLLIVIALLNFFVGTVQVLIAPLVLTFASPAVLGLVMSVASSGALVGGSLVAVWGGPPPRRRIQLILAVVALQGALLMVASPFASATVVALVAFFYLMIFPISTASSQAIWQSKTPHGLQGRVFAFRRMIAGVSVPLSQAIAGPVADHVFEPAMAAGGSLAAIFGTVFGTGEGRGIALMLAASGFCLIAIAALAARAPSIRRLEDDIADVIEDTPGEAQAPIASGEPVSVALRRLPRFAGVVALVLPFAVGLLALVSEAPPRARDATAPADSFSAARAMDHLEVIAQRPHPTGSDDHARVRDYLQAELENLGLDTMIQRQDVRTELGTIASLISVENVVAKLRGTEGSPAILLSAHYDTVPTSTGAADDGSGVASLLETARALRAGEPLRHDVIFLLTDAEEIGLHGARAFMSDHPWSSEVAVAVNIDARGHHGPVYMFQTGQQNGWWTRQLFEAVDAPRTSSFMHEIFRRMPNATDFNVLRNGGLPGFDLAMIRGLTHYHTDLDQPESVSLDSIQHQGAYTMGLARHLGDLDLRAARAEGNPAYFNVGSFVVHYPSWVARLLAIAALLVAAGLFTIAIRRRLLTGFTLMQGTLTLLTQLILVPVAISLLWLVVRDSAGLSMLMGSTEGAGRFMLAFTLLAAALSILVFRFFRRSVPLLGLLAGSLVWWLVLLVLTTDTLFAANSNFVAFWPLAGGLFVFGWLVLRSQERLSGWATAGVLSLVMLPGLAVIIPLTSGIYYALQSRLQLSGVALVPLIMLLTLLTPHFEAGGRVRGWWPSMVLGIAGFAVLGSAIAQRGPHRELSSALFTHDADHGHHQWFSLDPEPTQWTEPLAFDNAQRSSFSHFFPLIRRPYMSRPYLGADGVTPVSQVPTLPHAEIEAGSEDDGSPLSMSMTLMAPAGSRGRLMYFEPAASVRSVEIDGTPINMVRANGPTRVLARVPVRDRETLTVRLRTPGPLTLTVVEQLDGLPPSPLAPRGPNELPRPFLTVIRTDVTLVRRSFHLDPATDTVTPTGAFADGAADAAEADLDPASQPPAEPDRPGTAAEAEGS